MCSGVLFGLKDVKDGRRDKIMLAHRALYAVAFAVKWVALWSPSVVELLLRKNVTLHKL